MIMCDELTQKHEGRLSFATDAWTSPNHRAFVAVTVHFLYKEEPISMLLDIVEVPEVRYLQSCSRASTDRRLDLQSHTGFNLAQAFVKILQGFGIDDKVSAQN